MFDLIESPNRTAITGADRPPDMDRFSSASLAASIVHDLRNPLAAICGCAEMLLEMDLGPVQTRRATFNIHQAASRMRGLLADLMCITRGDAEVIERCNLRAIVAGSCDAAGVVERD